MDQTFLKETLKELIEDFYETPLPELTPRKINIPEYPRNATVITGMRRTGKTFLSYQRIRSLLDAGIPKDRILYLNFEDDRILGLTVKDFRFIPDVYFQMYPDNRDETCYFFFDEIQNIPDWESFVRRLVDTGKIQVYLTGSSAKMLTTEIATAMRGRSAETEVFPFSFEEFLLHHKYFEGIPRNIGSAVRTKIQHGLDQYFQIGGFPEVQNRSDGEWLQTLQGYVNAAIYRDVIERHKVQNSQALKYILQVLFNSPAMNISIHAISGVLTNMKITSDREYIAQYLDYLCEAYLVYRVRLHTDSLAKRRTNPDKYYLVDVGMVRAMTAKHSADRGHLLENMIFIHLRRLGYSLEYVLTKEKMEVDFLAFHKVRRDYRLIQVSYDISKAETFERETNALAAAGKEMHIKDRLIITWDEERELDNGIRIVPAWKFLLNRCE